MTTVLRSHLIERLFDGLAESLDAPRADPLDLSPDIVVVPTLALGRWLRERLARRNGVAMQLDTPYLAQYVLSLAMRAMPELAAQSPFEPTTLAWRLLRLFDQLDGNDKDLAPLLAFLAQTRRDRDANARMQLAERLARQFDRMTAYRSEWLAAWTTGKRVLDAGVLDTERWQSCLFRLILADLGADRKRASLERAAQHPVDAFAERLRDGDMFAIDVLPARLDLFAVPAVPPLYWRALDAIGRHRPVIYRQLMPTPVFIADLSTPLGKALARIDNPAAADLLDVGHPMLALWGRQAADLQNQSIDHEAEEGEDDFETDVPATLLSALQASVVDCRAPERDEWSDRVDDGSIKVVTATSLERQLEIVHDELLRHFDADPSLRPPDVAVLVPDIDAAAPAIEAVFGGVPRERAIDWRMTGRRETSQRDGLAAALLMLIDLVDSRAPFSKVAALLRHPACRRRFGIDAADSADMIERLHAAGARWGWDSAHRQAVGLAMEPQHTWLDAIDRLVMSYAAGAPEDSTELDGIAGSLLEPASAVLAALATIQAMRADWERPRSVRDWSRAFERGFESMFEADAGEADEAARIRAACAQLLMDSVAARSDQLQIDRRLARRQLEVALEGRAPGAMPTGAVTFAGIGPMRGVPFRIVALVGFDDHAWPRRSPKDEFNLMELRRQPADPSRRSEDRGALLDTLMATRDALIITYDGRDPRDGTPLVPALVVDELLDVLRTGCGDAAVSHHVVRAGALHGFSPSSFEPGRASFASEWYPAARLLAGQPDAIEMPKAFLAPRGVDPDRWRDRMPRRLSIDDLVSFMANPPGFFMRRGLRYSDYNRPDESFDEEPLGALIKKAMFCMVSRIGRARLRGLDYDAVMDLEQLSLPHGLAQDIVFRDAWEASAKWIERMQATLAAAGPATVPLMVDLTVESALGPILLTGQVARHENAIVLFHEREQTSRALIRTYVHWLVDAADTQAGGSLHRERAAIAICGDGRRVFVERGDWLGDPSSVLTQLVTDAAVGAVSPLAVSADAALKYVAGGDEAWRETWREDWDVPHKQLERLFPDHRDSAPPSAGIAGLLTFEQWAARLFGVLQQVTVASEVSIPGRLKRWSQPAAAARRMKK
ncbi:exodeoxyribonuclease V subunit gamma [soil metagenome]